MSYIDVHLVLWHLLGHIFVFETGFFYGAILLHSCAKSPGCCPEVERVLLPFCRCCVQHTSRPSGSSFCSPPLHQCFSGLVNWTSSQTSGGQSWPSLPFLGLTSPQICSAEPSSLVLLSTPRSFSRCRKGFKKTFISSFLNYLHPFDWKLTVICYNMVAHRWSSNMA